MRFQYLRAATIDEAVSLASQYGEKGKVIAGGTDLWVRMRDGVLAPEYVIDITGIAGLDYIDYDNGQGLRIGALTTIRALEKSTSLQKNHSIISQAASQLGSMAIRNVATIGGNLCNAAPSAETAPALLALSSKVKIAGPDGSHVVPVDDFFIGPGQTSLKKGELLLEIQVPPLSHDYRGVYLKHSLRGSVDLAIVGVAVLLSVTPESRVCQDIKIALGAVAPTPIRARAAEEMLKGKVLSDDLIGRAAKAARGECSCISDVRASAAYREEIVEVFTQRAIRQALGDN